MVEEAYISFEIAKLLKEKGFDEATIGAYYKDGTFNYLCLNTWNSKFITPISAPTIQMAMQWLREVHNIHITIYYSAFLYGTHPYYWSIDKMDSIPRADTQIEVSTNTHDYSFVHYEKCCEAAIKYCLENLI